MFRRAGRTLAVLTGAALTTVLVTAPAHAEVRSLSAVLSCSPVPNTFNYWASGSTTYQFEKIYYRESISIQKILGGGSSSWDRVSKSDVSDIYKYFDTPVHSSSTEGGSRITYKVEVFANATTNTPYKSSVVSCTV